MFPIIPANSVAAASGNEEGIFLWGSPDNGTNLISNTGVVSADTSTPAGATARAYSAATQYGGDKGIVAFGEFEATQYDESNLISNTGVVAADQAATTGTARSQPAACSFGGDKGIFGFGYTDNYVGMTNLVSNAGVVASDTAAVAGVTARQAYGACSFN